MRIGFGLALGGALALAAPLSAQDRVETVEADGVSAQVSIWDADSETPQGIILFGHGWGGQPTSYERLFENWAERGYTVRAATFIDSGSHPDHDSVDMNSMMGMQTVVGQRFNIIGAEREKAAQSNLPVILVGHSFGARVAQ